MRGGEEYNSFRARLHYSILISRITALSIWIGIRGEGVTDPFSYIHIRVRYGQSSGNSLAVRKLSWSQVSNYQMLFRIMTTDLRLWERNSRSKVVQRTRKIIHVNEITYLGKWGKIMHVRILARSRYAIIIQWRTISSAKRERERERETVFFVDERFFPNLILNA